MAKIYRVHGIELSPYSVKVRSYFRYKGIPHRWIPRSLDAEGEYQRFAKLPLVPLVVTPENEGIQDSTPIIEHVDALHLEPSIHPTDPVAKFVSILLEEFGDEWGNKWMFHYRWAREADQLSGAGIARSMMPTADDVQLANGIAMVRDQMVNRVSFVGSNSVTAPQIEDSFRDTLAILEPHFANRAYLFGQRPAFAASRYGGSSTTPGPTRHRVHSSTRPRHTYSQGSIGCSGPELRAIRAVVKSRSHPDAIARSSGRRALHSVDIGERASDHKRSRGVQRRIGRQDLDSETAEVSRQVARRVAAKVSSRCGESRSRCDPRYFRVSRGIARLSRAGRGAHKRVEPPEDLIAGRCPSRRRLKKRLDGRFSDRLVGAFSIRPA